MKKLLQLDQQQKKKHPKAQEPYNINMTINKKLKHFFKVQLVGKEEIQNW